MNSPKTIPSINEYVRRWKAEANPLNAAAIELEVKANWNKAHYDLFRDLIKWSK